MRRCRRLRLRALRFAPGFTAFPGEPPLSHPQKCTVSRNGAHALADARGSVHFRGNPRSPSFRAPLRGVLMTASMVGLYLIIPHTPKKCGAVAV